MSTDKLPKTKSISTGLAVAIALVLAVSGSGVANGQENARTTVTYKGIAQAVCVVDPESVEVTSEITTDASTGISTADFPAAGADLVVFCNKDFRVDVPPTVLMQARTGTPGEGFTDQFSAVVDAAVGTLNLGGQNGPVVNEVITINVQDFTTKQNEASLIAGEYVGEVRVEVTF